ncbi:MAG: hypothetical protein ACYC0L_08685 [Thermoleophilia bacterium]
MMRRITMIAVLAIAMLLVGATVVLAQDGTTGYSQRMMQTPATPGATNPTPPVATGDGSGVCPTTGQAMGSGMGAMGNGSMMNGEDMQARHEAMLNLSPEERQKACQDAVAQSQGSSNENQNTTNTRTRGMGRVTT